MYFCLNKRDFYTILFDLAIIIVNYTNYRAGCNRGFREDHDDRVVSSMSQDTRVLFVSFFFLRLLLRIATFTALYNFVSFS